MEEQKDYEEINLFNNPQIMAIKNSLPKEYVESLRLKGESMYKDIDFDNETLNHTIQNSLLNIKEALKSGLHPTMLESSEKQILIEELGTEWYKKFGYLEKDLDEI
jgi:hypothetical protein